MVVLASIRLVLNPLSTKSYLDVTFPRIDLLRDTVSRYIENKVNDDICKWASNYDAIINTHSLEIHFILCLYKNLTGPNITQPIHLSRHIYKPAIDLMYILITSW